MTDKFAILLFHSNDIYKINEGFSLKKGENSIGSDPDCDIVLNFDNEIEKFHCKITCYEDYDDISIEDISINHNLFKFVNNKKIKLKKRKEYEMNEKMIFYLNDVYNFNVFVGDIFQIKEFLKENQMEFYFNTLKNKIIEQKQKNNEKNNENNTENNNENNNENNSESENLNSSYEKIDEEDFNDFDFVPSTEKKIIIKNKNDFLGIKKRIDNDINKYEKISKKLYQTKIETFISDSNLNNNFNFLSNNIINKLNEENDFEKKNSKISIINSNENKIPKIIKIKKNKLKQKRSHKYKL
jgi:hypothetical protein